MNQLVSITKHALLLVLGLWIGVGGLVALIKRLAYLTRIRVTRSLQGVSARLLSSHRLFT